MVQKQKQPNEGGRRDDGTDGRAKQKTERGCAGSRLPNTTSIEFDPGATALGSVHPKIPVLHYERCGRL